jgi:hypothetical protein
MYNIFFAILFLTVDLKHIQFNLSENIKVTFSGASVTAQKVSYATELKKIFKNWNVNIFGSPGSHLTRCVTEKLYHNKPDIIFFEWSLHDSSSKEEIESIIWTTLEKNIVPIFIHMPRVDGISLNVIKKIDDLSKKLNFTVIDMRKYFSFDQLKKEILRDNCHPHENGAKIYADKLKDYLLFNPINIPTKFDLGRDLHEIKFYTIDKTLYNEFELKLNGYIFEMLIVKGPYSNELEAKKDGKHLSIYNLWDMFCYYERDVRYYFHISGSESSINFKLLNSSIDRSNVRRFTYNPSLHYPRLCIREICYIGNITDIVIDKSPFF